LPGETGKNKRRTEDKGKLAKRKRVPVEILEECTGKKRYIHHKQEGGGNCKTVRKREGGGLGSFYRSRKGARSLLFHLQGRVCSNKLGVTTHRRMFGLNWKRSLGKKTAHKRDSKNKSSGAGR